jgi:trimethylamine--corrinoid protein Co-methyltransferase
LQILETTGVAVHEAEALELLHGAGAHVKDGRVTIPAFLVEDAIRSAPSSITLFDRQGRSAMVLEGRNCYFGGQSSLINYQDPVSGERRELVSSDIGLLTRLIDALPNLHWTNGGACAADYESSVQHRVVFKHVVTNTIKPISFVSSDAADLTDILEMASIAVGGLEQLVERPFIIHYALAISPLTHPDSSVRKLLLCAKRGIPVIWASMPQGGATAPVTFAGILAQGNAESLSGLVIHQLCRPSAPFVYGAIPSHFEMKTLIFPYGSPELHLLCAAQTDMAHHYKLPMFGTAGCSDAKEIDAQAGAEIALSICWAALSGANFVHDVGLLDHGTILNPDVFVFADEVIAMVRQYFRPIRTDAEGLALDVIHEAGPRGTFLEHPHTLAHFKEHWYPSLFDRTTWERWLQRGARNLSTRLRDKTEKLLKMHVPKPLSKDVLREMEKLESKWLSGTC